MLLDPARATGPGGPWTGEGGPEAEVGVLGFESLEFLAIQQAVLISHPEDELYLVFGVPSQAGGQHGAERRDAGPGGHEHGVLGRVSKREGAERAADVD